MDQWFLSFYAKKEVSEAETRTASQAEADKIKIVIVTDAFRIYYIVPIQRFLFLWGECELCTVHMCFQFCHNYLSDSSKMMSTKLWLLSNLKLFCIVRCARISFQFRFLLIWLDSGKSHHLIRSHWSQTTKNHIISQQCFDGKDGLQYM